MVFGGEETGGGAVSGVDVPEGWSEFVVAGVMVIRIFILRYIILLESIVVENSLGLPLV